MRFIHDNRDRPFFLYLAHMYVHMPIYTPMNYHGASRNGPYGAAVAHLDFTTGAILDTLRDLGPDDNTIVLFTSDNGAGVPHTAAGATKRPPARSRQRRAVLSMLRLPLSPGAASAR